MKRKQGDDVAQEQVTSQAGDDPINQLINAAAHGDLSTIMALSDAGVPVDTPHGASSWTPILYALNKKHVECVRTLFQHGARIDRLIGTRRRTFLHIAAELEIPELISYFILNGVDPDAYDTTGWMAAHYAASKSSCEAIDAFIKIKVDLNKVFTIQGESALHIAARFNNEGMVNHLLNRELDPNLRDALGAKAIHHAAGAGALEAFNALLKIMGDAAVQEKDLKKRTVSHWAASKGHTKIISRILKTKNCAFTLDCDGRSVMHDAAESGSINTIEMLNVNHVLYALKDFKGRMPMHDAATAGHLKVVNHLGLHGGIAYDCADIAGVQPIHLAVKANHLDIVLYLKTKGVSLLAEDMEGKIPLDYAAISGHITLCTSLISPEATELKHVDKKGRNCLFHAARENQGDFILHLKNGGFVVDFKAVCSLGLSAIHHAAFKGAQAAITSLISCGLSINENEADKNGMLPIHVTCGNGDIVTFDFLVANGANIHATTGNGSNAICYAAEKGKEAMLRYLVEKKVQYQNIVTKAGLTPLHLAAGSGSVSCVKYFVEELGMDPCCTTTDDKKLTVRAYALSKNKQDVAAYLKEKTPKKTVAFRTPSKLETFFPVPGRVLPEKTQVSPEGKREREEEEKQDDLGSVTKK